MTLMDGMTQSAALLSVEPEDKWSRTDAARDSWMGALKTMHRLVRSKRKHFWRSRVDTGRDQASLWRVINDGLGRVGDTKGGHGLGIQNEAGERLIEFCDGNNLGIMNTWFEQPKRRLYTWTSPDGKHRNQIDYILINKR